MDSCESRERVSMSGHVLQSVQQAPRNRHCGLTDDEANSILNYNHHDIFSSTGTSATPAEVAGCTGGGVDELYETDPIDLSDEVLYTKTPPHEEEAESCMHVFFDEQGCIFQARPPPPHEDISETVSAASTTDRFASHQPAHKMVEKPLLHDSSRKQEVSVIPALCKACSHGSHTPHTCGKGRGAQRTVSKSATTPSPVAGSFTSPGTHHKTSGRTPRPTPPPFSPDEMPPAAHAKQARASKPSRQLRQQGSASSPEGAARAKTVLAHVASPTPAPPIAVRPEKQPVNPACTYELCPNPTHTSSSWKMVTEETKAGGRDWSMYCGRVFCNACFTQYATTGSIIRKVPPKNLS